MADHYSDQWEEYDKKRKEQEMSKKSKKILDNWVYDPEECTEKIELDIPDDLILKLALLAHEEDITLNHLINKVVVKQLKDSEYTFEHGGKPQLLNEGEK